MPRSALLRRLAGEARDLGFLGPGPLEVHLDHARAFAEVVEASRAGAVPASVLDLGSGGGFPALALASRWESAMFLLVEARGRRAAFLLRAVGALGLSQRVTVAAERAELLGRTPLRRGAFDVVTARSFGPPAVVAECAAPFLAVDGLLVVSEPPQDAPDLPGRWPETGLAELGLGGAEPVRSAYGFVVVPRRQPCPPRFPRRVGVPAKRPLF